MRILNSYRIQQRQEAKQSLEKINIAKGKVLVIHYSCESFYGKAGYTPRVTSIGILNKENNESTIFSLHLTAQIMKINLAESSSIELDEVERTMLSEFNSFVDEHKSYVWIHWNMRSASYGFKAISNRFRILGGNEIIIPDTNKVDLRAIFGQLYTYNFEKDEPNGQLLNLAERNNISGRDALPGREEASAFEQKDYLLLHMSTLRKVEIIDRLLSAYQSGKLKHNSRRKDVYDLSISGIYNLVKETPILLLIWSVIMFIIGTVAQPLLLELFGLNR